MACVVQRVYIMLCILECTRTGLYFCCEALLWLVCACEGFVVLVRVGFVWDKDLWAVVGWR